MSQLVSVVIPCRNEYRSIRDTVVAILNSSYPEIEVIVVDGMSEDGTRQILSQLANADPRVRVIDNPRKLTPFAFNLGVEAAQGEFVQIVGSRNILSRNYIGLLVDKLDHRPEIACVGGDFQHVSDSPRGRYLCLAMESKFGMGAGNYRTMSADAYVDTVGLPLYRKSIFEEIGMFDQSLTRNQDDDFNFRVRQRGHQVMYVHKAKATYLVRGSLKKAFDQFFQYGYFKVFVSRKHRKLTTVRQLAPAAFIATLVVGFPLAIFSAKIRVLLGLVALVYIAAGMRFAGKGLTLKDRWHVMTTCFVLHMGYGLGYWQGVFDFMLFRRDPRAEFQRQTT